MVRVMGFAKVPMVTVVSVTVDRVTVVREAVVRVTVVRKTVVRKTVVMEAVVADEENRLVKILKTNDTLRNFGFINNNGIGFLN